MTVLTDKEKAALRDGTRDIVELIDDVQAAVIKRLAAGVSVEPVASFWRERNQSLYPGISIGLTTAGDALPLGERHKLYDATAIAAARVQENERCAKVCESTSWSEDIDVWREMTKRDVSVKSMLACAEAIRASIGETK